MQRETREELLDEVSNLGLVLKRRESCPNHNEFKYASYVRNVYEKKSIRLNWHRLLLGQRAPFDFQSVDSPSDQSVPTARNAFRSEFEKDYDRVIFSTPFRRLAKKTQVHPLAPNDHVHNRLTHSIEVASVGRSFAARLSDFLINKQELADQSPSELTTSLSWIMQAACLIHDIGNPPFGHAGEHAIRAWSNEYPERLFPAAFNVPDESKQDWYIFEGNAQGFRIAARHDNQQLGYLRVTGATLAAAIKYPWTSSHPRSAIKGKHNVYSTEKDMFEKLWTMMDLVRSGSETAHASHARHPLSFLTEAADDICYRILDLEDAAEMKICSEQQVRDCLCQLVSPADRERLNHPRYPLARVRSAAIHYLINVFWHIFEEDYENIMHGEREQDLRHALTGRQEADERKILADGFAMVDEHYKQIFALRSKTAMELGSYKILGRILKAMTRTIQSIHHASLNNQNYSALHFLSKRTIELTWGEAYAIEHFNASYPWWLAQVRDYVAGLTDNYAIQLSKEIEGF